MSHHFCGDTAKVSQLNLPMGTTSDKPKQRNILQNKWPVFFNHMTSQNPELKKKKRSLFVIIVYVYERVDGSQKTTVWSWFSPLPFLFKSYRDQN